MRFYLLTLLILAALISKPLLADVDKIYHPYVEENRYELETRAISLLQDEMTAGYSFYRVGFGKDLMENLFVELNLIGSKNTASNFDVESYELEALYQATEQGEYWADFGLLFEIKRTKNSQQWEGNFGLLLEKEYGRVSATVNLQNELIVVDDVRHDWKFNQSLQLRYRYSSVFEPGFEFHSGPNNFYIGPVIMGQLKFGYNPLNWELGFSRNIGGGESENAIRALIEFEF